ncbi:MAG: hypothetical protein ACYS47_14955, partial [Planctomycetota bacterium]
MDKAIRFGVCMALTALAAGSAAAPLASAANKASGGYVVLTNLPEKDPYYKAVRTLLAIHPGAKVVSFPKGDVASAAAALKKTAPRHVVVVLKPADLDMNFQGRLLTLCTGLDDDPFCDFAFGYVTGATAEEAAGFAANIRRAWKKPLPKRALEVPTFGGGPSRRTQGSARNTFGVDWPL